MDLGRKLQLKADSSLAVIAQPSELTLEIAGVNTIENPQHADAVVAFAITAADLNGTAIAALEAAQADRIAWIAYPKAGQLGTDLNRDRLAAAAGDHGVRPVRQIAIDEVWSALRFRPA